jgi:hypothetical protein
MADLKIANADLTGTLKRDGVAFDPAAVLPAIWLDPTGFDRPDLVAVSYDSTARTITLGGTGWKAYWRGVEVAALVPTWESAAHSEDDGTYFLYYNGSEFVWGEAPWEFSNLHIAIVFRDTANFCLRECHGLMPWTAHREFHDLLGTYLYSGGDLDNYALASTTATNRRPTVDEALIYDEDLPTTLPALSTNAYARLSLTSTNTANFAVDQTEIINLSTNQPYWNEFTGGAWQQTLFSNNHYGKIFVMAVPVTADTDCQKARFVFVQPQTTSATLATIQGVSPASLSLGHISSALAEYVFIGEIIIRYTAGNWQLIEVNKLTGSRRLQISGAASSFAGGDLTTATTARLVISNYTASTTLTAAECRGAIVTNAGATGTIELTLPAAATGSSVTIYSKAAEIIELIPASGERFSSELADVQLDSDGVLGSSITLVCMETGVWEIVASTGTWEAPA